MKKARLFAGIILHSTLFLSGNLYANSNNIDNLPQQVSQCETCHNANTPSVAPVLNGMQDGYIQEQLENFKAKKRGLDSKDPVVIEMARTAEALTQEQISFIADYFADKDKSFSKDSVPGNSQNGEVLYQEHCNGCHSSTFGRFFTNSPKITHLEGSYLLAQLKLFAAGKRQFLVESKHKTKMVEVAKRFSDEELSDIVAYIKTHFAEE